MALPVPTRRLVLASGSQPRRRLLEAAGFAPEVVVSGVDEDGVEGLPPEKAVLELAERKATPVGRSYGDRVDHAMPGDDSDGTNGATTGGRADAADLPALGHHQHRQQHPDRHSVVSRGPADVADLPALVLACDTILLMDGVPYGKPSSLDEARDWVRWQRNREVEVVTGHCLVDTVTGRRTRRASWATVEIGDISDAEIEAYLATGEALNAAGALTIDGYGAPFVAGLRGDHGTVVGLSLGVFRGLLAELAIPVASLWVLREAAQ